MDPFPWQFMKSGRLQIFNALQTTTEHSSIEDERRRFRITICMHIHCRFQFQYEKGRRERGRQEEDRVE